MLDIEHGHVYVFSFNITQTRNRFFNLLKSTHLKFGSGLLKLFYLVVEFTKKPVLLIRPTVLLVVIIEVE